MHDSCIANRLRPHNHQPRITTDRTGTTDGNSTTDGQRHPMANATRRTVPPPAGSITTRQATAPPASDITIDRTGTTDG
jgi:hypothetical protein